MFQRVWNGLAFQTKCVLQKKESFWKLTILLQAKIQGEDYVLVLQMEIIKLLIFGEEYQKKLIISFQHH